MQNDGFYISFFSNMGNLGTMYVTGNMMFAQVVQNLIRNYPWIANYQTTFVFNSNEIKSDSSRLLREIGIQNMSYIEVRMQMPTIQPKQPGMGTPGIKPGNIAVDENLNICFSASGRIVNVQATRNMTFSELSKKFCVKADEKEKVPSFLLNSSMIDANDKRTLAELRIQNNQRIEVVFTSDVVGA